MARMKPKSKTGTFSVFNVIYEDGTVTSNRRVPSDQLDQSFGDGLLDLAKTAIEKQDMEISERSGQKRAKIKSIVGA